MIERPGTAPRGWRLVDPALELAQEVGGIPHVLGRRQLGPRPAGPGTHRRVPTKPPSPSSPWPGAASGFLEPVRGSASAGHVQHLEDLELLPLGLGASGAPARAPPRPPRAWRGRGGEGGGGAAAARGRGGWAGAAGRFRARARGKRRSVFCFSLTRTGSRLQRPQLWIERGREVLHLSSPKADSGAR